MHNESKRQINYLQHQSENCSKGYEPNAIRSLYVLGSLLIGWKGQELNGTCMSEASDVSD